MTQQPSHCRVCCLRDGRSPLATVCATDLGPSSKHTRGSRLPWNIVKTTSSVNTHLSSLNRFVVATVRPRTRRGDSHTHTPIMTGIAVLLATRERTSSSAPLSHLPTSAKCAPESRMATFFRIVVLRAVNPSATFPSSFVVDESPTQKPGDLIAVVHHELPARKRTGKQVEHLSWLCVVASCAD